MFATRIPDRSPFQRTRELITALKAPKGPGAAFVSMLVTHGGALVNGIDENGDTVLSLCARFNLPFELDEVLQFGAEPNQCCADGLYPLHIAAMLGHTQCIDPLLAFGADIDARDRRGGATAFELAVRYGRLPAARKLAERGAAIDRMAYVSEGELMNMRATMPGLSDKQLLELIQPQDVQQFVEALRAEALVVTPAEPRLTYHQAAELQSLNEHIENQRVINEDFVIDADEDDNLAEILPEHCKLVKSIGQGTFSTVYRGTIEENGRKATVAFKVFNKRDVVVTREEILREARLMHSHRHSNIVRLMGITELNDCMVIVMRLYRNTLKYWISKHVEMVHKGEIDKNKLGGPSIVRTQCISIRQFATIAGGIAAGMRFLHDRKIVHRDLKPDNVLLDDDWIPYITDMGQAKELPDMSMAVTRDVGTALYSAPEVTNNFPGQSYDPFIADICSYGATLYHVTTGERPVIVKNKETGLATLKYPALANPDFEKHPQIRDFIAKCVAEKPADRYQSFAEVQLALRDAVVPKDWQKTLDGFEITPERQLNPMCLEAYEEIRRSWNFANSPTQFQLENAALKLNSLAKKLLNPTMPGTDSNTASRGGGGGGGGGGKRRRVKEDESDVTAILEGVPRAYEVSFHAMKLFSIEMPGYLEDVEVVVKVNSDGYVNVGGMYKEKPGRFLGRWEVTPTTAPNAPYCYEMRFSRQTKPCIQMGTWYFGVIASWSLVKFTIMYEVRKNGVRVDTRARDAAAMTRLGTRVSDTRMGATRVPAGPATPSGADVPMLTMEQMMNESRRDYSASMVPPPPAHSPDAKTNQPGLPPPPPPPSSGAPAPPPPPPASAGAPAPPPPPPASSGAPAPPPPPMAPASSGAPPPPPPMAPVSSGAPPPPPPPASSGAPAPPPPPMAPVSSGAPPPPPPPASAGAPPPPPPAPSAQEGESSANPAASGFLKDIAAGNLMGRLKKVGAEGGDGAPGASSSSPGRPSVTATSSGSGMDLQDILLSKFKSTKVESDDEDDDAESDEW